MLSLADEIEVVRARPIASIPDRVRGVRPGRGVALRVGGGSTCPAPSPARRSRSGIDWASRITTLGLRVRPAGVARATISTVGWGRTRSGLLVGMVFGFAVGMLHLLRIARDSSRPT